MCCSFGVGPGTCRRQQGRQPLRSFAFPHLATWPAHRSVINVSSVTFYKKRRLPTFYAARRHAGRGDGRQAWRRRSRRGGRQALSRPFARRRVILLGGGHLAPIFLVGQIMKGKSIFFLRGRKRKKYFFLRYARNGCMFNKRTRPLKNEAREDSERTRVKCGREEVGVLVLLVAGGSGGARSGEADVGLEGTVDEPL
jgi:hypothetical protein